MCGTRFETFLARLVKMHINELMDLEVDLEELNRNGSNQPPSITISASAPSLSMSSEDL